MIKAIADKYVNIVEYLRPMLNKCSTNMAIMLLSRGKDHCTPKMLSEKGNNP